MIKLLIRILTVKWYVVFIFCQQPAPFQPLGRIPSCPTETNTLKCNFNNKYSLIDGSCNNLQNPWVGKSNTPYKRYASNAYNDGVQVPRKRSANGQSLPNPVTKQLKNKAD